MNKLTLISSAILIAGGTQVAQAQPPGGGAGMPAMDFDAINTETADSPDYLTEAEVNAFMHEPLAREFPIHTGSPATLAAAEDRIRVSNSESHASVQKVLAAIGRRPNLADLELEQLGIDLDDRGVPRYDPTTMQVADLPIFIAGDANARSPVLHEASDEGRIAGFNAVQNEPRCFQRRTRLSIVFSEPNIAVVGKTFAETAGPDTVTGETRFERQGRARMLMENAGVLRIYGERSTGRLLSST